MRMGLVGVAILVLFAWPDSASAESYLVYPNGNEHLGWDEGGGKFKTCSGQVVNLSPPLSTRPTDHRCQSTPTPPTPDGSRPPDRKSTRLNSSH